MNTEHTNKLENGKNTPCPLERRVGQSDGETTPWTDGFGSSLSLMDFQSPFPYPNQNIWDGALAVYHSPSCVRLRALLPQVQKDLPKNLVSIFYKVNWNPFFGDPMFRWSEVMTADDTGDPFRITYLSPKGASFLKALRVDTKNGTRQAFIDFIHSVDPDALKDTEFAQPNAPVGQYEAVVLAHDYYQPLPLMDLDDEQLAKISTIGNSPDENARNLYALWAEKNEIFPENLIGEIRGFCTSGLVWKHTSPSAALRARGVVWIVGLTEIGVKMFAAIRADDGSGEVWRSFLHDINCDKLKNVGIETPNA